MKKNLFKPSVKDEVIERANRLTEQSERQWGSMAPAEMLHHCTDVLKATISSKAVSKPDTVKQKVLRFLMLNFIPKFPQGKKTSPEIDIKRNNIIVADLQNEQQQFADLLDVFVNHAGSFKLTHPYFGNLSRNQWGILTWMHLDHHLRQFGV